MEKTRWVFVTLIRFPTVSEISLKANQTQPDSLKLIQTDLMHIPKSVR